MPRTWIRSNGGPLLLLPVTHLGAWHGTDPVDAVCDFPARGQATDYDRACAVADYTGPITVGAAEGLVLGLPVCFELSDSPLELFDSAESGDDAVGERLRIDIPAGVYNVDRADHRPDVETWFPARSASIHGYLAYVRSGE